MARILIVDDEPGIRSLLYLAFQRAGYGVRTAASAAEARALCANEPFDMVLSDVLMPQQTGHDLVRWLVANYPNVRYALMTAFNVECEDCPLPSRCPILQKPFQPKDAVALVETILKKDR